MEKQLTLGSLFDGSGTCPLAASLCGAIPLWASEIEKFPIQVTSKRFPNMKHVGDITKINGAEIEPVDIITFGSPCTNLSVAGKQNGFNITFECFGVKDDLKESHFTETTIANDNSKYLYEMDCPVCGNHLTQTNESALFFNAIRIIREMREATNNEYPRFIMWENVPGAFSSNKGSDFRKVLEEITETEIPMSEGGRWATSGMVELYDRQLAWRVLDAQYWGVPQRRKRIFLVTDFRGKRAGEILFKPESLFRDIEKGREKREGTTTDFERSIRKTGTESRGIVYSFDSLASNSMKSKNPYSGCREVDIAKTIDTTTQDPSKNQGGIAILNTISAGFMAGQGAKAGSIGYKEELSPTLKSVNSGGNTVPSVITYGFCPDNSITAGGVTCEEEKTATLSTTKRMGVVAIENHPADSRVKIDDSGTIQTLTGRMGTGGGNVPLILNDQGGTSINVEKYDISPTLRSESHGNQPIVAFACNQRDEVRDLKDCAVALQAQPGMKQQTFCLQGNMIGRDDKNGPLGDGINEDVSFTLNATDRHAIAYTPAGFADYQEGVGTLKSSGGDCGGGSETLVTIAMQRSNEYKQSNTAHTLAARDYKSATDLVAGLDCRNGRENGDLCGTLQAKQNGGFSYNCTHPVRIGNTVRRLTPTECARLQGFPDWWCSDIDHSDTAEYKMWGNGMALPCVLYIMQNISDTMN